MYRAAIFLMASSCLVAQTWPKTIVEESNYERTATVADIKSYMAELMKAAPALRPYQPPNAPTATETGKPLLAWRLPATGPNPIKVYINANIHPGEVEGKEAMLFVMREILQGKRPEIRKNIEIVVCPAYNADGTDALNPAFRTHQPNPKSGVGPRENAFGLDLNRDLMKAAAANTRWMLAMYRDYDPDCTIDLHSTNGSRHGFFITHSPACATGGDVELGAFNRKILVEIRESLKAKGLPTYDYGNFRMDSERREPVSWETESLGQNIASNYPIMENRLGVLVETLVYRAYEERVADNIKFIFETLEWMAKNKAQVQRERKQAIDRWAEMRAKGNIQLPLKAKAVQTETYSFESFEFARDDQNRPLRDEKGRYVGERAVKRYTLPSFVTYEWLDYVPAPIGYLVDRTYADKVLPLLEAHGVRSMPGTQRPKNETLLYFHETERKVAQGAYQGVITLSLGGAWKPELPPRRTAYAWEPDDLDNALFVPIDQPMGKLAFYLLDPRAPDGLVFWGFFHASYLRGPGMWGEGPRQPILAVGIKAAGQPTDANAKPAPQIEEY
ncbi:MAG: hypothetical protein LBC63_01460 [Holophagales bacterium]|jgi:hypothetical protein|nr:hypothetical protein [Holophagales bacterium]